MPIRTFLTALLALALLAPGASAATYTMSTSSGILPLNAGGTPLWTNLSTQPQDDATVSLTTPFPVRVGNTSYDNAKVSTNGNIHFGDSHYISAGNDCLPTADFSTSAVVMPYWDDIVIGGQANEGVWHTTRGDAPTRQWILTWSGHHYSDPTQQIDFQVIFYEGSGAIRMLYDQGTGSAVTGDAGATIGVQLSSSDYNQFTCPDAPVAADRGTVIDFTLPAPPALPTNTTRPAISGTPQVGQTLTASTGTWTGSPDSYEYEWRRCVYSAGTTGCSPSLIAGVTGPTYTLTSAERNAIVWALVRAHNVAGWSAFVSTSNDSGLISAPAGGGDTSGGGTTGGGTTGGGTTGGGTSTGGVPMCERRGRLFPCSSATDTTESFDDEDEECGEECEGDTRERGSRGGGSGALTSLKLAPAAFRAAARGASVAARRATGTKITYGLSSGAEVVFSVERKLPGRRAGSRCVAPKKAGKRAKKCARWTQVRGSFSHEGTRGDNTFRFTGVVAGDRLARGNYRVTAVAGDASGGITRPFRIIR